MSASLLHRPRTRASGTPREASVSPMDEGSTNTPPPARRAPAAAGSSERSTMEAHPVWVPPPPPGPGVGPPPPPHGFPPYPPYGPPPFHHPGYPPGAPPAMGYHPVYPPYPPYGSPYQPGYDRERGSRSPPPESYGGRGNPSAPITSATRGTYNGGSGRQSPARGDRSPGGSDYSDRGQQQQAPGMFRSSSPLPRLPPILPVERRHVTTTATQAASASRRRSDAPFVCSVPGCGSTFTRRFNLRGHMRSHTEERPFLCEFGCGKSFARQHDCRRHEQLHSKTQAYACSHCNKSFSRMDALNRHLRSDGGAECRKHVMANGGTANAVVKINVAPKEPKPLENTTAASVANAPAVGDAPPPAPHDASSPAGSGYRE